MFKYMLVDVLAFHIVYQSNDFNAAKYQYESYRKIYPEIKFAVIRTETLFIGSGNKELVKSF